MRAATCGVNVYRPPSEFTTGMSGFIRDRISADPHWLEGQANALVALVDDTRMWIEAAVETPMAERATSELLTIVDEFFRRNVEIGPRYILMLWFPIQMESHPDRTRFERSIDTAVRTRELTHTVGGMADDFARKLAAEALHRQGLPESLARVVPIEMLRAYLRDESEFDVEVLHAYNQCFLVAAEGVLHEDVHTYALRKDVFIQEDDEITADENIVNGMVAFPGKARGRARLVRGPEDFPSFVDGDILLTSMTTPDFEQVLARAAGIVTDEGGATSHAAILARELRIPTVIGTRTATRIFSAGDLLEVNADDGLVQKLPIGKVTESAPSIAANTNDPHLIYVIEDNLETRRALVREFYRQAGRAPLLISEEGNSDFAVTEIRRLTDRGREVSAVIVNLLLGDDPFGGVKVIRRLRRVGYPPDRLYVFSVMATSATRTGERTRAEVFRELNSMGISRAAGNLFGKVRPGYEEIRDSLQSDEGELATVPELVTAVFMKIGLPASSPAPQS